MTGAPAGVAVPSPKRRIRVEWIAIPSIFFAVLAVWEGTVRLLGVKAWLLPAPSLITLTAVRDFVPILLPHTWITLQEVLIGFVLGGALGLGLGIVISQSATLERVLSPYILAVQTTPKVAIAPLFVIWLGFGIESKVLIVLLIAFFPIMTNAVTGFNSLDAGKVDLMRSLTATRWQIFTKARFPNALPYLFAGARIAIVQSVVGAVAAEFVGAREGLGYLVLYMGSVLETPTVFAVLAILVMVGVSLYWAMAWAEKMVVHWEH